MNTMNTDLDGSDDLQLSLDQKKKKTEFRKKYHPKVQLAMISMSSRGFADKWKHVACTSYFSSLSNSMCVTLARQNQFGVISKHNGNMESIHLRVLRNYLSIHTTHIDHSDNFRRHLNHRLHTHAAGIYSSHIALLCLSTHMHSHWRLYVLVFRFSFGAQFHSDVFVQCVHSLHHLNCQMDENLFSLHSMPSFA